MVRFVISFHRSVQRVPTQKAIFVRSPPLLLVQLLSKPLLSLPRIVTITHYPQPQSSPPCAASFSASSHLWLSPRSRSSPGRPSSAIYHHPLQIMVVSTTGISRRQDLKGSHYHDRKLASDLLIDRRGGPCLGFGCAFVP